ncbi:MAG: glycosyltransferase [Acidimicrobiales bacterium]
MTVEASFAPTADVDTYTDLAVILPCHDVESTLAVQLDRLVEERWTRPWCIVVVDNSSRDQTRAIAERYAGRGVRIVTASQRRGAGYARNAGAEATSAPALAFCDGDDVVAPGWVAAIGDALERHELVGGMVDTTLVNDAWIASSRSMAEDGQLGQFGEIPFAPSCNCGIRRDLFDRLDGFDEDFDGHEDVELSLRARALGVAVVAVPDAVIGYRLRSTVRELWRQGTVYGRGRPLLIIRAHELGLPAPSRVHGVRSWAWLVVHLPALRHRAGRYRWLWVAAFRVGVLRRAVELRRLYL